MESVILSHYYLFLCCIVLVRWLLNCLPIHVYLLFMELDPSSLSQRARLSPTWLNPSSPDATPTTLSLPPAHQPESIHPVLLNALFPFLSLFFPPGMLSFPPVYQNPSCSLWPLHYQHSLRRVLHSQVGITCSFFVACKTLGFYLGIQNYLEID